jgi:DNA topoisomerase-1
MPYTLVIVESPAKCKKIEGYLGSEYKCIASFGHIRELPGLKNIDVDNNFNPHFQIVESKQSHISKMSNFIKKASKVLLATDDDREGEGIAWHICQQFELPLNTPRIIFHEITKPALERAVSTPTVINMDVVHAQQARQVLDVIVGYKISPLLWQNISRNNKTGLSAGRCQTPALRLVYDNQKDIDNSPGRKVYNTTGFFTKLNLGFNLNHNFEIVNNKENLMELFLEESVSHDHVYNCSKPKMTKKSPPTPFTTSALQQKSSSEFNISPKETMSICQKLYESGLITYMRTDSTTFSKEFLVTAESFIKDKYGDDYVSVDIYKLSERSSENKSKKKKKKDEDNKAQEAHEAIRPTDVTRDIIEESFSPRERKIYRLIWSNTVESCMSDAKYNSITAKISAPLEKEYKYSSEQVIFPGWKAVKGVEMENSEYTFLLQLKNKTIVHYNKISSKVSIKDLKQHYTEAKLVQMLEQKGIGRPSTFSTLIEKIQTRGYVKKENVKGQKVNCVDYELIENEINEIVNEREFGNEKNKLVIQQLGIIVLDFLLSYFDELFNYDYTKSMENELDDIAKGNKIWSTLCETCYNDIENQSSNLKKKDNFQIQIDNEHTYMVGKYGPVIKKGNGKSASFINVKNNINIEKIKDGTYKLSDIIETSSPHKIIGKYKGDDVYYKKGKYGNYLECGDSKKSLNGYQKNEDEITDDDIQAIFEGRVNINSSIIRKINNNSSIRRGKYGNYIFHKTETMSKPKFIKLSKFKGNYNTCPLDELEKYIDSQ